MKVHTMINTLELVQELYLYIACFTLVFFIGFALILLIWVIVLFKESIRLKKKAKYLTLFSYNEDANLQALNSKVEYRKSLLLFAIIFFELFACFLILVKLVSYITHSISTYETGGDHLVSILISSTSPNNCNITPTSISFHWSLLNHLHSRVALVSYGIPFIISCAFILILMSYYTMAIKKSLNYNTTLESMNLSRKQKALLWSFVVVCIILCLLLIRSEVYLLYELLRCTILFVQSLYIVKYSVILSRVLRWKVVDNRIAYGTESDVYKLHVKSWRSFKRFGKLLSTTTVMFCITDIAFLLEYILEIVMHPYELYILYGICIRIIPTNLTNVFEWVHIILHLCTVSIQFVCTLLFFLTGLISIPFLLSKTSLSCCFSFHRFNANLKKPLLN